MISLFVQSLYFKAVKEYQKPVKVLENIDESDDSMDKKKLKKKLTKKPSKDKNNNKIDTKKVIIEKAPAYSNDEFNFSMLMTDDDDDDDEITPEWSLPSKLSAIVNKQNGLSPQIVDEFFGSQFETVDLFEIFPSIQPKRAKRRKSSMVWKTPPRYSILPKY